MSSTMDTRAAAARLMLEQDRQELRQTLGAGAGRPTAEGFPRSATFRWLTRHLSARSLASTALSLAMTRPGLLPFLGRWMLSRAGSGAGRRKR